jgi:hypothetical protein
LSTSKRTQAMVAKRVGPVFCRSIASLSQRSMRAGDRCWTTAARSV